MIDELKLLSPITQSTRQQLQQYVIYAAIERYLNWRNAKDSSDGRDYVVTFFSRLRHFTAFGERRARQLQDNVASEVQSPLKNLQQHFATNSRINNHSLDTYLLEAIWATKELFNIQLDSIDKLRSQEDRLILLSAIQKKADSISDETIDLSGSHNAHFAAVLCHYFANNCKSIDKISLKILNAFVAEGNCDAKYAVAKHYYHLGQFDDSLTLLTSAVEKKHAASIDFLNKTVLPAEQYFTLGQKYEHGDGVERNYAMAVSFYEKALALKHRRAALCLGDLYQLNHPNMPKNISKAFSAYVRAVELGEKDALKPLERLALEGGVEERLKISELYTVHLKKPQQGQYWKMKAQEAKQSASYINQP